MLPGPRRRNTTMPTPAIASAESQCMDTLVPHECTNEPGGGVCERAHPSHACGRCGAAMVRRRAPVCARTPMPAMRGPTDRQVRICGRPWCPPHTVRIRCRRLVGGRLCARGTRHHRAIGPRSSCVSAWVTCQIKLGAEMPSKRVAAGVDPGRDLCRAAPRGWGQPRGRGACGRERRPHRCRGPRRRRRCRAW